MTAAGADRPMGPAPQRVGPPPSLWRRPEPPSPAPAWTPPTRPLADLLADLHAVIDGRPGWRVVACHTLGVVHAECRTAPGAPGGSVTGGSSGWWWTADDGAGQPLGSNLDRLAEESAVDAVGAVEQAIAFPPTAPKEPQ